MKIKTSVMFLLSMLLALSMKGDDAQLVIASAESDFGIGRIYIKGNNFGNEAPSVKLSGQELTLMSFTTESIDAVLPAGIAPGSYVLFVSRGPGNESNAKSASLDVTLGAAGPRGPKGDQGLPGAKGDKGNTGPQGLKGEKGDKGDRGDTGLQGVKGDIGDPGPQGVKGDKGEPGVQGPKGDKGDKGDRGDVGLQGLKGDPGDAGPQGIRGDKGDAGIEGPKGEKGEAGSQGVKGDPGSQGVKGDKGDSGSQGLKGDRGDIGPQGPQGPQGSAGTTGQTAFTITATSTLTRILNTTASNVIPGLTRTVDVPAGSVIHLDADGNVHATTTTPACVEISIYIDESPAKGWVVCTPGNSPGTSFANWSLHMAKFLSAGPHKIEVYADGSSGGLSIFGQLTIAVLKF
jgi:hypothetical protein